MSRHSRQQTDPTASLNMSSSLPFTGLGLVPPPAPSSSTTPSVTPATSRDSWTPYEEELLLRKLSR